jgi:hypothetical protein
MGLAASGFALARLPSRERAEKPAIVHDQGPAVTPLLPLLEGVGEERSMRSATDAIGRLWNSPSLAQTTLRASVSLLRRLDLPAVLELSHPSRRDTCFVALLGLEQETALVSVMDGPAVRVSISELDELWSRDAVLLWPDPVGLARVPQGPSTSDWARRRLGALGYPPDAPLSENLARFQKDAALVSDGLLGQKTIVALYSLDAIERPRLSRPPATGGPS